VLSVSVGSWLQPPLLPLLWLALWLWLLARQVALLSRSAAWK
jgi:hypothetical protein